MAKSVAGNGRRSRAGKRTGNGTFDGVFICGNNGEAHGGSTDPIQECRELFENLKGHRNLLDEVWIGSKGKSLDVGQQRLVTRVLSEMRNFIQSFEQYPLCQSR